MSHLNFNPLVVFLQKQLHVIALGFHGAEILITAFVISLLWPSLFFACSIHQRETTTLHLIDSQHTHSHLIWTHEQMNIVETRWEFHAQSHTHTQNMQEHALIHPSSGLCFLSLNIDFQADKMMVPWFLWQPADQIPLVDLCDTSMATLISRDLGLASTDRCFCQVQVSFWTDPLHCFIVLGTVSRLDLRGESLKTRGVQA